MLPVRPARRKAFEAARAGPAPPGGDATFGRFRRGDKKTPHNSKNSDLQIAATGSRGFSTASRRFRAARWEKPLARLPECPAEGPRMQDATLLPTCSLRWTYIQSGGQPPHSEEDLPRQADHAARTTRRERAGPLRRASKNSKPWKSPSRIFPNVGNFTSRIFQALENGAWRFPQVGAAQFASAGRVELAAGGRVAPTSRGWACRAWQRRLYNAPGDEGVELAGRLGAPGKPAVRSRPPRAKRRTAGRPRYSRLRAAREREAVARAKAFWTASVGVLAS